ncbi:hypothetical protein HBH53_175920 [Parastagonospora nodorum]|nr:hypothetical protein HBH53_175920 [Parastagonospora nodorum]KAH4063825.1 hypothetical protein HBH50_187190 [Parastagonospora nodorum]KAH4079670.1 hypothetical protein HBH48_217030 [Parastagonospora nodorum]KAH4198146.1 hypothetical protein HBI95_185080 [Parastagonospora nodorum]KAH4806768.1 hypothetical protein HBH61_141570 [Parastagonospora nodorum]
MLALVYKALSATGRNTQHYKSCVTVSNYINKLPPELRLAVLQHVSHDDLNNMCVLDYSWRDEVTPVLWGDFDSDLSDTNKQRLDMVLTHKYQSFFKQLRNLYVQKSTRTNQSDWMLRFQQLIDAITPHTLVKVVVANAIDSGTLGMLIMNQKNLVELSVPVLDSQGPPGPDFVDGNLGSVKRLSIFPNADQAGYDGWLENTTALEVLKVWIMRTSLASLFIIGDFLNDILSFYRGEDVSQQDHPLKGSH